MLPVKKYYEIEENQLNHENYDVFSTIFFEKQLLICLSQFGNLYRAIEMQVNKRALMKEYVLGFRAILGVGIALNAKEDISQPSISIATKTIENLMFDVYEKALDLKYTLKDRTFYSMFSSYLILGEKLGFNFDDISYVYEKEMRD